MAVITIGTVAIDRPTFQTAWSSGNPRTKVAGSNPANAAGTIDTIELWFNTVTGTNDVWGGTFSASGNILTCRDSESLGAVSSGSKQTFTGLDIDVETGDYLGMCPKTSDGTMYIDATDGASNHWNVTGEFIDPSDSQTYSLFSHDLSLYGTGATIGLEVSTQAVTDISGIATATGNGNITSLGEDANADKRGFVYDTTSRGNPGDVAPGSTAYTDYVEDTGSYSTGAFTKTLTGLSDVTTYYVRAFSHGTTEGYSYGDEVAFRNIADGIFLVDITSDNTDNATSVVVDVSGLDIQDDDLILFFGACDGIGYNLPSGFTLLQNVATGGTHKNILAYKVADTEGNSYTVTTASSITERGIVIFAVYRNVDPDDPIESSNSNTGGQNVTGVITSITPDDNDDAVVVFTGLESGNAGDPVVLAWPGSLVGQLDNVNGPPGTAAGSSSGAFADEVQGVKGAVSGNIDLTGGTTYWGVMAVVLNRLVAGGVTHLGAATLSGVGTLTGIGRGIFIGQTTLSGVGTLAGIGRLIAIGKATLLGSGSLSAIGQRITYGIVSLVGTGTLAASAVSTLIGKATLSGVGSLSAIGSFLRYGVVTLTGQGTLVANGVITAIGQATLSGVGTLAAIGTVVVTGVIHYGKVTLSGVGSLAAILTKGIAHRKLGSFAGRALSAITKRSLSSFTGRDLSDDNDEFRDLSDESETRNLK